MGLTFLDTDAGPLFARIKTAFETFAGRVLYPAQVENLLLKVLTYVDSERRIATQYAAEQNLVAYATGEHLDALGVMMATPRLQPTAAECRIRLTLDEPSLPGRSFPAGLRITTEDGKLAFETLEPCYVISGQSVSSVAPARCTTFGTRGNGLDAGVLCELDPKIEGATVENVTATEGGGDLESDTAYRERLMLSTARFGCGGSAKAYRYWALSASSLVADALAMADRESGDIHIYVLSTEGEPSQELLARVETVCNADDVRLINDYVRAFPANRREYAIHAEITVYDTHDPEIILDKVRILAAEYATQHRARLGADVTPTQVLLALKTDGLYQINLTQPAEIIPVSASEFAKCTGIDIRLAGVTNG